MGVKYRLSQIDSLEDSEFQIVSSVTVKDTLEAISLLLNAESCSRVSGTAVYKSWGKGDLSGAPKRVDTVQFMVDNELHAWSERNTKFGETRRYSKDTGQELVGDNGALIPPKPPSGFTHWPLLIKMLRPSRFGIWGRPDDRWRMTGAELTEYGHRVHFDRDESPASAELFIDAHFSLPIRWTEVYPLGPDLGAKSEVEIKAMHVPDTWKRKMGMDMSEQGELRAMAWDDE